MLSPSQFKAWADNLVRDARKEGLPDVDIICELIDQLKRLLTHIEIKVI